MLYNMKICKWIWHKEDNFVLLQVAVEHVCEDEQLVSHIKELLKEIGPG